jgi:hypothetical protein
MEGSVSEAKENKSEGHLVAWGVVSELALYKSYVWGVSLLLQPSCAVFLEEPQI